MVRSGADCLLRIIDPDASPHVEIVEKLASVEYFSHMTVVPVELSKFTETNRRPNWEFMLFILARLLPIRR